MEALMMRMPHTMPETAIEASEMPGGDGVPLHAALARLKAEKAREMSG
jgi:hypothetical protein